MKNLITLFGILIGGLTFGQQCNEPAEANYGEDANAGKAAISLYAEPFKQKNYTDAKKFWWPAQKAAPKYKPVLYSHGVYIYEKEYKKAKDEAKKDAITDTIFMIYDLWIENFGDCRELQVDRGSDYIKYKSMTKYEEGYNLLNKGMDQYNAKEIKSDWINKSILAAYLMVGNKKGECDLLLDQYDKLSQICEVNLDQYKDNEKKKGYYTSAQAYLDQKVAPCASCDKLEELFIPKVKASPNDTVLIKKAVKMLDGKNCNSSEFYTELATKIHTWEPTAESAISLGNGAYSNKDYKTAADFYEEGLSLTTDETEKAKLYEKLAGIELSRGSYKSAASYARKMDDKCKANGILARAIAMSAPSCGSTKIEASYVYGLAIDYAEKASGCVSSSTIAAWQNRLAGKADLFLVEITVGQTVSVPCWGETTKVRSID